MNAILAQPLDAAGLASQHTLLARLLSDAVQALEHDRSLARNSLSQAVALLEQARSSPVEPNKGLAPWQARKTVALIEKNLEAGIRVSDLAAEVRLSPSYFSKAFKEYFGRSPQQFILARRVERAQYLMLTSDSSLCDIALAAGFADQAHLSRLFRKLVGLSPNSWRRAQG